MVITTAGMMQPNANSSVQPNASEPSAPTRKVSDNRRSNKPIMEKRRRARINNCLSELKTLILDATKKDPARHSKLEKADILEMTVQYLKNQRRQQGEPHHTYREGYTDCATQVDRFPGLDSPSKRRLLQHLANYLSQGPKAQEAPQGQVHILPNSQKGMMDQRQGTIVLNNGTGAGVQLVPTRLPNGDIALVLPTHFQQPVGVASTMPLLVPIIPERTASNASSASFSTVCSRSTTPEVAEAYQPKPLALVVRKPNEPEEEKPWRPW